MIKPGTAVTASASLGYLTAKDAYYGSVHRVSIDHRLTGVVIAVSTLGNVDLTHQVLVIFGRVPSWFPIYWLHAT